MARVTITLRDIEHDALVRSAELERREPRAQAAVIVRDWLIEQKLLTATLKPTKAQRAHVKGELD